MIAATSDLGYKTWDNRAITRTGATGAAIGTGLANTNAIISQLGAAGSYNYAAGVSANYSVNDGGVTYDDWFLPSKDELYKLYINKAEIGGFTGTYYWSSTESSSTLAFPQAIHYGGQPNKLKNESRPVRTVRTFSTTP